MRPADKDLIISRGQDEARPAAEDPEKPADTVIEGYWMGLAKRSFQVS